MADYQAPLRDIRFVIHEWLGASSQYSVMPAFAEIDGPLLDQTLGELARFTENVLAPLNGVGDAEGCELVGPSVRTPTGFADAYRRYVAAGWPTLGCAGEHGGQGMPALMHAALVEMLCGANQSWAMYPLIAHGIYKIISRHADPALQALFLPPIVSGEWTTTMCLTEPQAGSDLGLLRTRAEVAEPLPCLPALPTFRLNGSKIFISGGDQDWTDNIIHLVLARLPDAPPGVRGISLFLVPKRIQPTAGAAYEDNGISVAAVEQKMGLKGSATCALSLEGARGWLVGQPHQGLAAMFILMNEARLNVGIQALSAAQGAYSAALRYARERQQMRPASGPRCPELAADPIIHHPDVRRMLLTQKARIEGGRMLGYWMAHCADLEAEHQYPGVREHASNTLALLTPIAKAFLSDNAFDDANLALQIFGGHGYLKDHGVEQRVRDIRITQIYEGTNGVQARDLLSRKIIANGGRSLALFLDDIKDFAASHSSSPDMKGLLRPIENLVAAIEDLVRGLVLREKADRDEADAAAWDTLHALGHLVLAYLLAQAAHISLPKVESADPFYASKLATARFYITRVMPKAYAHIDAAQSGLSSLSRLNHDELFV